MHHLHVIQSTWRKVLTAAFLLLPLAGCTNLVFQPMRPHVFDPREHGVILEDRSFAGEDGVTLHGWWLPARDGDGQPRPYAARGTVIFLHGNAENISTHIASVHWLPKAGYNVYLYDYRGYGKSGGISDYELARRDVISAIDFVDRFEETRDRPLFVLGQSLGGAIAISALGGHPARFRLSGVIVEGTPSSLRKAAREVLGNHWLTWLLQYPLSGLIDDADSPQDRVGQLAPLPVMIIHSRDDRVVPFHHGEELQRRAPPNRVWYPTTGPHIGALQRPEGRKALIEFLESQKAARRRDD
jgi:uncharacterized protein